jgi:hypothetical protein
MCLRCRGKRVALGRDGRYPRLLDSALPRRIKINTSTRVCISVVVAAKHVYTSKLATFADSRNWAHITGKDPDKRRGFACAACDFDAETWHLTVAEPLGFETAKTGLFVATYDRFEEGARDQDGRVSIVIRVETDDSPTLSVVSIGVEFSMFHELPRRPIVASNVGEPGFRIRRV